MGFKKAIIGFIFSLALFMLVLIHVDAKATSTFMYSWENTIIHIPYNDELAKYEKLPIAYLYENGERLDDAKIEYQREGDWLYFLKDVNTAKVGKYFVWYKAYEYTNYRPGTCNGYKCKITFIVEDKTPPKLLINSDEIAIRRQKENDKELIKELIENNVKAFDDYSDVTISFNHKIDLRYASRYKVEVFVNDESTNQAKGHFYFDVFDDYKPLIFFDTPNDLLKVNRNDDVNIKSYFKATDELDGDITDKIIYPVFDLSKLGVKEYEVSVTNSGGNKTTKKIMIEVVDNVKPEIILTTDVINLDYQLDLNDIKYDKYILEIKDDLPIDYSKLRVTNNLENKVGIYHIYYEYNDGVNLANAILEVRLISYSGPIVEVEDVIIKEGAYIDLNDYVSIYDPSDFKAYESLRINDDEVNYNVEGTYYASVYCVNSSGMSTTKKIQVVIKKEIKGVNVALIILSIALGIIILIAIAYLIIFIRKKKNRLN